MKDVFFGTIIKGNSQPMVDFKYDYQKNRNPRKSMFQIFSPKKSSKKVMNNNPKELYKASNKINSILSKNLRSIYNENKNDINQDNPLFENVNCLIQKNTTSNKYLYNQMTNFKNNLNQKYHRKESNSNTFISNNSEKDFRDSTIIRKMEKLKKNNLFRTSIKNTDFKKN